MTSYPWESLKPQAASWSPDGRFIAFHEEYRDLRPVWQFIGGRPVQVQVMMDLWRVNVVNVQTGQVHIVVEDDYGVQPTWTNDGRLVFASTQGFFVVDFLETNRQVSKVPGTDPRYQAPAWSPTGEWIAFQWRQHDHQEIGIMRPDGSGFRLLTSSPLFTTPANNVTPAWSPDGKRIAFVSDRNGPWELFVMNADGSDQHKVDLGGLNLNYENVRERILDWGP
jgi:Tol biopolymer transport system component